jgi:hypothetical protein
MERIHMTEQQTHDDQLFNFRLGNASARKSIARAHVHVRMHTGAGTHSFGEIWGIV